MEHSDICWGAMVVVAAMLMTDVWPRKSGKGPIFSQHSRTRSPKRGQISCSLVPCSRRPGERTLRCSM